MEDALCDALCRLDKAIDATMFLTLGAVALTLAVFLHATISQLEESHRTTQFKVPDDARHELAQKRIALGKIMLAWWFSVFGVVSSLSLDLSVLPPVAKSSDLSAHLSLIEGFRAATLLQQVDAGVSAFLLSGVIGLLSYGSFLMFPNLRYILLEWRAR